MVAGRALLGWSEDELAGAAGMSAEVVRKVEAGEADDFEFSAVVTALGRQGVQFISEDGFMGVALHLKWRMDEHQPSGQVS